MSTSPIIGYIEQLREEGWSYREIGRILGFNHSTVYRWHRGVRRPRDYNVKVERAAKSLLIIKIIDELRERGLSYRKIAGAIGVDHVTVFYWHKRIWRPRNPDHILNILLKYVDENLEYDYRTYKTPTYSGIENNSSVREGDRSSIKSILYYLTYYSQILQVYDNPHLVDYAGKLIRKYVTSLNKKKIRDQEEIAVAALIVSTNFYRPGWLSDIKNRVKEIFQDRYKKIIKHASILYSIILD